MADLAVVGHIAIDKIVMTRDHRMQIGGSPTYVSLITKKLGLDVGVVTKVGGDVPDMMLKQIQRVGIDLRGRIVEGAETTRFTIDYRKGKRKLSVEAVCQEIYQENVSNLPETILISPIMGEVPPSTYSALEGDLIALDPQGLVRGRAPNGVVQPIIWFDPDLLRRLTIYKSSEMELKLVVGEENPWRGLRRILNLGAKIAIATRGSEGLLLLTPYGRYIVPAYEVEVEDPTGAGDVFMGGFLFEYLRGGDDLWCTAVGAAAASYVVETAGANLNASVRDLRRRAEELFNEIVKL